MGTTTPAFYGVSVHPGNGQSQMLVFQVPFFINGNWMYLCAAPSLAVHLAATPSSDAPLSSAVLLCLLYFS